MLLNFPVSGVAYFVGVFIWSYYHLDGSGSLVQGRVQGGGRLLEDAVAGAVGRDLRGRAPVLKNNDEILPYFAVHELPPGMSGLIVAAIFAATMSTISSGVNALTTVTFEGAIVSICLSIKCRRVITTLRYPTFHTPPLAIPPDFAARYSQSLRHANEEERLRYAKRLSGVYAVIVVAVSFLMQYMGEIIPLVYSLNSLFGGPTLGLFLLGEHIPGHIALGPASPAPLSPLSPCPCPPCPPLPPCLLLQTAKGGCLALVVRCLNSRFFSRASRAHSQLLSCRHA
jgi:hypothetical protein